MDLSYECGTVDEELRLFIKFCRRMPSTYDRIHELRSQMDGYGVSSPRIKNTEEAKYQEGTKIYSDKGLINLITTIDSLTEEYAFMDAFCLRVQRRLMELSDDDVEVLYYRYECGYTLRQMAAMYFTNKDSMSRRLGWIFYQISRK